MIPSLSNALSPALAAAARTTQPGAATTSPAGRPPDFAIPPPLIVLTSVGLCVLVVWIVRRALHPEKFTLARTPGRPNTISPAHLAVLFLLWLAADALVGGLVRWSDDARAWRPQWLLLGRTGVQLLWIAGSLFVASRTFRMGLRRGLGLSMRHWLYDSLRGIVGYLAVIPICIGLQAATAEVLLRLAPETVRIHPVLRQLPDLAPPWLLLVMFSTVVLAPVAEEVFFRGLVQSALRRYTHRPWLSVLATSAVFAAVHMQQLQDVPALFALSVALGYNYERCGRLYPSMLIHALFNAVFIAVRLAAA
jgi:membrane protease YdiL (CAAX protease family)